VPLLQNHRLLLGKIVLCLLARTVGAHSKTEKLAHFGASRAESAANGTILPLLAARLPQALTVLIS